MKQFTAQARSLTLASLMFVLGAGCSLRVSPDAKQCETTADCAARGDAFEATVCVENVCTYECTKSSECTRRGDEFWNTECYAHRCELSEQWGCVEPEQQGDKIAARSSKSYVLTFSVTDMLTGDAVPDVTGSLCLIRDLDCEAPLGQDVVSDVSGVLALSVPGNFEGYVRLLAEERVTGLYFPSPLTKDRFDPPVTLPTSKDLLKFAALLGGGDEERGTVMLQSVDCTGKPAAEVSFESDEADLKAPVWYSENSLPVGTKATDQTGYGGFFNMPSGLASIRATLDHGDHVIGTVGLVIKPGALSYGRFIPNGS